MGCTVLPWLAVRAWFARIARAVKYECDDVVDWLLAGQSSELLLYYYGSETRDGTKWA